jgi:hypothetical protein
MRILVSVLLLTLACDVAGVPDDLPHAAANFTCGPTDGPATAITLARDPITSTGVTLPYVQVTIDEWPPADLAGGTWVVGRDLVGAWYVPGSGAAEIASIGRVAVGRVDSDSTIHGEVSLTFPSRRVVGTFTAPWIDRSGTLCG